MPAVGYDGQVVLEYWLTNGELHSLYRYYLLSFENTFLYFYIENAIEKNQKIGNCNRLCLFGVTTNPPLITTTTAFPSQSRRYLPTEREIELVHNLWENREDLSAWVTALSVSSVGGVVLVFLIIGAVLYRRYHHRSVNLASSQIKLTGFRKMFTKTTVTKMPEVHSDQKLYVENTMADSVRIKPLRPPPPTTSATSAARTLGDGAGLSIASTKGNLVSNYHESNSNGMESKKIPTAIFSPPTEGGNEENDTKEQNEGDESKEDQGAEYEVKGNQEVGVQAELECCFCGRNYVSKYWYEKHVESCQPVTQTEQSQT